MNHILILLAPLVNEAIIQLVRFRTAHPRIGYVNTEKTTVFLPTYISLVGLEVSVEVSNIFMGSPFRFVSDVDVLSTPVIKIDNRGSVALTTRTSYSSDHLDRISCGLVNNRLEIIFWVVIKKLILDAICKGLVVLIERPKILIAYNTWPVQVKVIFNLVKLCLNIIKSKTHILKIILPDGVFRAIDHATLHGGQTYGV